MKCEIGLQWGGVWWRLEDLTVDMEGAFSEIWSENYSF